MTHTVIYKDGLIFSADISRANVYPEVFIKSFEELKSEFGIESMSVDPVLETDNHKVEATFKKDEDNGTTWRIRFQGLLNDQFMREHVHLHLDD